MNCTECGKESSNAVCFDCIAEKIRRSMKKEPHMFTLWVYNHWYEEQMDGVFDEYAPENVHCMHSGWNEIDHNNAYFTAYGQ